MIRHLLRLTTLLTIALCASVASADAQSSQFPPPAGPVTICGTQTAPNADTYQLVFDGGAAEPVSLTAPDAACPAGSTHSFTLPAARFTVGQHTLQVIAINAFGSTTGPAYTVTVGIAPGPFSITAVVPSAE